MQKDLHGAFIPGTTRIKYGGAYLDDKEFSAIQSVLDRNWWTIDEHGRKLEEELASFIGLEIPQASTLTNSGSSALMVAFAALRAHGVAEDAEIITGGVQFPTTISSLYYNRLTPVYIDVDPNTFCLNPELIEDAITEKTAAILVVAIAGNYPNLEQIQGIAKKHNLLLVLDNCDGFGGTWYGLPIENYFDISATSFHAAHIMAMGEGGAVNTRIDTDLAAIARSLREWGRYGDTDEVPASLGIPSDYPGRYVFKHMGFNVKPLELQCAMGREQLKKLPDIKLRRSEVFKKLHAGLQPLEKAGFITLPRVATAAEPSWFGFPLLAKNRPGLRKFLEDRQIETRTVFGGNITRQPGFIGFGRINGELSVSDQVFYDGMFTSCHPSVTDEMIDYMVASFKEYYGES